MYEWTEIWPGYDEYKIKAETLYIEMHKDSGDLSQSQYTDQMLQLFIQ